MGTFEVKARCRASGEYNVGSAARWQPPTLKAMVSFLRSSTLKRLFCAALLAGACLQSGMFASLEVRSLHKNYSAEYAEGHVLWMAMQMADRHTAYQPIDRLPFVLFPYTPLYMLTTRAVGMLTGDLLLAGRALSLACTLAISLVLGLTVFGCLSRRASLLWRWAAAGFAGTQFLLMQSVVLCAPIMRVDMLALCFAYAGLAVFICAGRRQLGQCVAVALFVLAVFTKQIMLPIPLTCLMVGLLDNWRQTVRAYALGAVLGIAGLAACISYFGGNFLNHVFFYNAAPFSIWHGLQQVAEHLHQNLSLAAVAAAACFGVWKRGTAAASTWSRFRHGLRNNLYFRAVVVAAVHFAATTAWLLSIGKHGSAINYFLEWDMGACLLGGLFVFRLLATWKTTGTRSGTGALAYLLLPSMTILAVLSSILMVSPSRQADWDRRQTISAAHVIQAIRDTPGPVFSEEMLLALKAGKPLIAEMASATFMAQEGKWDERPLVKMMEEQRFGLVVVRDLDNKDLYTPAMKAAVEGAYIFVEQSGVCNLYRPRPR